MPASPDFVMASSLREDIDPIIGIDPTAGKEALPARSQMRVVFDMAYYLEGNLI
jgi:hypothetical protein